MKLRFKFRDCPDLRISLNLTESQTTEDQPTSDARCQTTTPANQATCSSGPRDRHTVSVSVATIEARLRQAVEERVGVKLTRCRLSMDGVHALDRQLYSSDVAAQLGIVSGDLIHVLDAQFAALDGRALTYGEVTQRLQPSVDGPSLFQLPQRLDERLTDSQPVPQLLTWLVVQQFRPSISHTTQDQHDSQQQDASDWLQSVPAERLLFTALHALLLETGLLPCGQHNGWTVPDDCWRRDGGIMLLRYRLADLQHQPQLEEQHQQSDVVTMSVVDMGASVAVHAFVNAERDIHTLHMRVADYIVPAAGVMTSSQMLSASSVQMAGVTSQEAAVSARFKRLRQLSARFKTSIAVPLLAGVRRALSLPETANQWRHLPAELQVSVMRLLDVASVLRLAATCRAMHVRAADPLLWRWLLLRDFHDQRVQFAAQMAPHDDWRLRYQQLYKQQRAKSRPPVLYPPIPAWLPGGRPPPLPLAPPLAPPLAGIVGGEYDRIPGVAELESPLALLARPRRLLHEPRRMFPRGGGRGGGFLF